MKLTDLTTVPVGINEGLSNAKMQTMLALLGNPRSSYDVDCQEVTNSKLARLMVHRNVGPFRIRGLKPAVDDLAIIFSEVKANDPELYKALGTAGMLCARLVRGTTTGAISNHSWGTAIDMKINDLLDRRRDDKAYYGLVRLSPYFNRHQWYWGAAFGSEDAMHFEVSDGKIREWHAAGAAGESVAAPEVTISLGDRGPEVKLIQERLNALGADLKIDGVFGPTTRAAVVAFQSEHGLTPDGVVGSQTAEALRV